MVYATEVMNIEDEEYAAIAYRLKILSRSEYLDIILEACFQPEPYLIQQMRKRIRDKGKKGKII